MERCRALHSRSLTLRDPLLLYLPMADLPNSTAEVDPLCQHEPPGPPQIWWPQIYWGVNDEALEVKIWLLRCMLICCARPFLPPDRLALFGAIQS